MTPKFKNYGFGDMNFRCYFKPAGHGYEVGITCKSKPVFVGNFVHAHEAQTWWKMMCKEMSTFCHKYEFMPSASFTWYCKFAGNHMYKCYYAYLDQAFSKYNRDFKKAYARNMKDYRKYEKSFYRHAA